MGKSPKERGFSFDTEKRDQEIKLANGSFEIERKVLLQIIQLMHATLLPAAVDLQICTCSKHQLDKSLKEDFIEHKGSCPGTQGSPQTSRC